MISGLCTLSRANYLCYPYVEAITSFLPVVDEMVIALDFYSGDGTRETLLKEFDGLRLVPVVFDIAKYGWISYGIAQTTGYQACKGDVVMMFNADGVLHEKDVGLLRQRMKEQEQNAKEPFAYWMKNRFYGPTLYYNQYKHSGVYTKKFLGDRFHFYFKRYKGVPNTGLKTAGEGFRKLDVKHYGYEHLWDTEDVVREKVNNYGRMIDQVDYKYDVEKHESKDGQEIDVLVYKKPEYYYDEYVRHLVDRLKKDGKQMPIDQQPKIIQEKLRSINETHFGYNCFGKR